MADLDGSPVTAEQLQALALAPYGHFTSIRVDDGRAKGITLHMERLSRDARKVFGVELDTDRVRELARQAVADTSGPLVMRITIYDPATELGRPADATDPHVLITKRAASANPPSPIRAELATYERELAEVKHISLFGTLRARRWAQQRGFDDVVFMDRSGVVTEGATWNIGLVRGADVVWPDGPVLPGVTAELINGLYETKTIPVPAEGLGDYEAAFATNTTVGVRPIAEIGGEKFDVENPILKALQSAYAAIEPEEF
jgi:branched-subunit amino acid aminotransferase/4-amino-4-deoxychorismate lyase